MAKDRRRLDVLLAERGLAASREEAKRRVLAGEARVNGERVTKAGAQIAADAEIELIGLRPRYASRGGFKLERALEVFCVDPTDMVALDAGASTGGFTDCLLQHGARLVHAVDVGYGQIAWNLRNDPRVKNYERTNVRYATRDMFDPPPEMMTADLSFIGLTLLLPIFATLLPAGADLLALVKPQFEAGRAQVQRGGVIRDPEVHLEVLRKVAARGATVGLTPTAVTYSPLRGPAGNIEFLMRFVRAGAGHDDGTPDSLDQAIANVVPEAHAAI
jgi:23S rRNA (cytidine1920-2'-O)/16S rRNA (cytidine1409-2'-O)-methyltransferase